VSSKTQGDCHEFRASVRYQKQQTKLYYQKELEYFQQELSELQRQYEEAKRSNSMQIKILKSQMIKSQSLLVAKRHELNSLIKSKARITYPSEVQLIFNFDRQTLQIKFDSITVE